MQYVLQQITEERAKRAIAFTADLKNMRIDYSPHSFSSAVLVKMTLALLKEHSAYMKRDGFSYKRFDDQMYNFTRDMVETFKIQAGYDIKQRIAKQIINAGLCTKEKQKQIIDDYMAEFYPNVYALKKSDKLIRPGQGTYECLILP